MSNCYNGYMVYNNNMTQGQIDHRILYCIYFSSLYSITKTLVLKTIRPYSFVTVFRLLNPFNMKFHFGPSIHGGFDCSRFSLVNNNYIPPTSYLGVKEISE